MRGAARRCAPALLTAVFAALGGPAPSAAAADGGPYFHFGLPYGSDAAFHPARELLNGAFGILQISRNRRTLDEIDFGDGLSSVLSDVGRAGTNVREYGARRFVTSEILPYDPDPGRRQFVPNYTLHLIGGGARHRAFVEWYDRRGVGRPGWWAAGTSFAHALAVEAVERATIGTSPVDPVADLLLFDPAGILLFSSDRVARFFSGTMNLRLWSAQPVFAPHGNALENPGQNYATKVFFGRDHRVGLFQYWGMSGLVGVTVRGDDGRAWSVGTGFSVESVAAEDPDDDWSAYLARLQWDAGLFWDRNGSLLASLQVSEGWTQRLRVNVFPGAVRWGNTAPGFVFGVTGGGGLLLGMSVNALPIGLAMGG